jgi:hypothetical protein
VFKADLWQTHYINFPLFFGYSAFLTSFHIHLLLQIHPQNFRPSARSEIIAFCGSLNKPIHDKYFRIKAIKYDRLLGFRAV